MRLAIAVAACGLVLAAPVVAPTSVMSKAEAQSTTMTMEERTLQAQVVALAQAGDTDGIKALIRTKIAQGKAALVAKVAKSVAAMSTQLAGTDSSSAASLASAAIVIASNSRVAAADSTVEADVGRSAAQTYAAVMNTDPARSAQIQQTAADSGSQQLAGAFTAGVLQSTGSTQTAQSNQQTVVVVRQRPATPPEPVVPIIIEPNPDQAGSPT